MAVYIEKLNGYIADVPNIDFTRCDGTAYNFYEVNTANVSDSTESLTITGGQSNFPLAMLDTTRTLEMSFESSQFTMDMFEMANAAKLTEGDAAYDILESDLFEVVTGPKIEIEKAITAGSVKIRGMESADTASTGKFSVATSEGKTTITFASGDVKVGDAVRVTYRRVLGTNANVVSVKSNSTTAKGEATFHWPVYSSGTDCTESAIKGWLHLTVFRCRVTALPGMDSSYKSAATIGATFTAIDPKRADKKLFDWVYEIAE